MCISILIVYNHLWYTEYLGYLKIYTWDRRLERRQMQAIITLDLCAHKCDAGCDVTTNRYLSAFDIDLRT